MITPSTARPAWQVNARERLDRSPVEVCLELTRRCGVCSSEQSTNAVGPEQELSPAETRRLVDQMGQFPEPPRLRLTGADVLERPDVFSLVEYAARAGLKTTVVLAATRLAVRKALWRLRSAGVARLALRLEGSCAAVHDDWCQRAGSFERSWEIIETAGELSMPLEIVTTLRPANCDQIGVLGGQLARTSTVLWSVAFLVPEGPHAHQPRLRAEQCEQAFRRLWLQSRLQSYRIEVADAPHFRRFVLEHYRRHGDESEAARLLRDHLIRGRRGGVNDGKGTMFVSRAGLIFPSRQLPIVCGVFPLAHLVDVYQNSPVFRALRDSERLEGKCSYCEYRRICGGSRARAYAVTGNPFAQEPDCNYVPLSMRAP